MAGGNGVRVQRQGNAEILRDLFGLKEVTFLEEVDRCVYPVMEVRATRFWEEFHEGIIRWSARGFMAAVVAEFSGISIRLDSATNPPPSGTVYTIDEIDNNSGQTIDLRRGTVITPVSTAVSVYTDARWAGPTVPPPVLVTQGSNAAPGGTLFDQLQAARSRKDGIYVSPGFDPNVTESLGIFGGTLNTSFSVVVRGRIILPR